MRSVKHLLTLAVALGSVGLTSCSTPKPECTVGQTTTIPVGLSGVMAFSVRYVVQSNPMSCPELSGDVIGMQSYHPASTEDPNVRDFGKTTIALRTQSLGELAWMNEDFGVAGDVVEPNAIGDFTNAEPDASDLCQVTAAEARVVFPGAPVDLGIPCTMGGTECTDNGFPTATCEGVDPMDPTVMSCIYTFAPTDLGYKWSNMQFYVTAAATGTQFSADVDITLNGCTATYKAVGMWPAVDCTGITAVDDMGNPTAVGPLDEYCHPEPDPTNQLNPRPYGSGISPDFGPVVCDPTIAVVPIVDEYYTLFAGGPLSVPRCVLANDEIPQLEGFAPLAGSEDTQ